ncbi:MAG: D-alanine--D-alanine ligase [Acidobacteriota bacterium]|nr:MAG: D-alanine--D-alanine ligase [Acidobacteriota bacterium]
MKKRVAVIFGGRSGEHEISIRSAKTVIEQIDPAKYEIVPLAISRSGAWLTPEQSIELFPEATRTTFIDRYGPASQVRGLLTGDSSIGGFVGFGDLNEEPPVIDVIFPVLHGTYGEDGTIQGLFEMSGLPYVGCGVLASSCGMDKVTMKILFRDAGLPICRYVWFLRSEWDIDPDKVIEQTVAKIGLPCFVKPANLGSSVGISKASTPEELRSAIDLAAEYDRKIIVEEAIEMRELECAVMGNDSPEASLPGEYVILDESKRFLDYTEKYSGTGNNEFVVPAPISEELSQRVRQMAVTAFKAVDGSGLARVDLFLRNDNGALLMNEINTLPGLTDASGFPKMWAASGKPLPQLIDELIELAIERFEDRRRNKTII